MDGKSNDPPGALKPQAVFVHLDVFVFSVVIFSNLAFLPLNCYNILSYNNINPTNQPEASGRFFKRHLPIIRTIQNMER
jgi:hypothetical protein